MRNLPQRNNNPLDLRFAGQREATGPDQKGFAMFPTPEAGWRAAHRQIQLDQQRGLSLGQFIRKFAPPSENNTENYLDQTCAHLVVDPKYIKPLPDGGFSLSEDTPIALLSPEALAGVMAMIEGYYAKEAD